MKHDTSSDVMVLGGGPAGCAAAITLASQGRRVQLFEREAAPRHKVCGEFLSHEALAMLQELGLDPLALGAVPLHGVRLAGRGRAVAAELPFRACSLTRKALDAALLERAAAAGVHVRRGVSVQEIRWHPSGWAAELSDGQAALAREAMLATGKHDLRGQPRPHGAQQDLIAFKMYWRLAAEQEAQLAGHVELALFRGGYAGLQPVEGGLANLCIVVKRSRYRELGGRWPALLAAMQQESPHLRERLALAEPPMEQPLAIAPIPYGMVRRDSGGLWRLGDQAAVIPSFTGDGMSIALHSGMLAARMLLAGRAAREFQHALAAQVSGQVGFATWLSRLVVAEPLRPALEQLTRRMPAVLPAIARRTRLAAAGLAD